LEWDEENDELIIPILEALAKKGIIRKFEIPKKVYEKIRCEKWQP
jgi:hypothetical protein